MGTNHQYFVRFTSHPKEDLKRGFSLVAESDDKKYLKDLLAEDDGLELIRHPYKKGWWALRVQGLCGYGPYDSLEEAESARENEIADVRDDESHKLDQPAHIFEGEYLGDDGMGGEMFRPTGITG